MSWISSIPWDQPSQLASTLVYNVKEWWAAHSFGYYALAILAVLWANHIIVQLVFHLFSARVCLFFSASTRSHQTTCYLPPLPMGWKYGHLRDGTIQILHERSSQGLPFFPCQV